MDQLKKDIASLEEYRKSMERQQVDFPLDTNSQAVVHIDLMVPTGRTISTADLISLYQADPVEVLVNGTRYQIPTLSLI